MNNPIDGKPPVPFQKTEDNEDTEVLRQKYAEEIRLDLQKYKEQIIQFNLLTVSPKLNAFWDTNEGIKPVIYDSRYDKDFEFYGLERGGVNEEKTGYILDKPANKISFQGYLGRSLKSSKDRRDGNGLYFTIKFNKDFDSKDLIQKLAKLMDTIVAYRGNDNSAERTPEQDIKNIAKEGITVLEAFQEISEKFPSTGHISVKSIIEEYKEILK